MDPQFIEAKYDILGSVSTVPADISFTDPTYPLGRCLLLSLPSGYIHRDIQYIIISLNSSVLDTSTRDKGFKLKVHFNDPINQVRVYLTHSQMTGDPVTIPLKSTDHKATSYNTNFKTKVYSSYHVEDDPLFECKLYSKIYSYNDCIREELSELFQTEFGCLPPLYGGDNKTVCNHVFNFTPAKDYSIKRMFWNIADYYKPKSCKPPCTKTSYASQFTYKTPTMGTPSLWLAFDPMVSVTRSSFSLSGHTLVTRLGGSVSSGRTLLWACLSLLTAINMLRQLMKLCSKEESTQSQAASLDCNQVN